MEKIPNLINCKLCATTLISDEIITHMQTIHDFEFFDVYDCIVE